MKKKTFRPQLTAPVQRTVTTATTSSLGGVSPAEYGINVPPDCVYPFAANSAK
ncbi:MAG: hypothetical protein EBE86_028310 [Hormoscilla sp. GUM202]|nr:hypothetical protein [Hormoscilla sp. GUM202]